MWAGFIFADVACSLPVLIRKRGLRLWRGGGRRSNWRLARRSWQRWARLPARERKRRAGSSGRGCCWPTGTTRRFPVDVLDVEARKQRRGVGHIKRITVLGRGRQVVAASPPRHVRTDHSIMRREGLCDRVEILGIAGQTVDADERPGTGRARPLAIDELVKAGRAEARKMTFNHCGAAACWCQGGSRLSSDG